MATKDELEAARWAAMETKLNEVHHHLVGNGKPGLITRLYRLEWAVLALALVAAGSSTPVAKAIVTVIPH